MTGGGCNWKISQSLFMNGLNTKNHVNSTTRQYVITTVSLRSAELAGISLVFEESQVERNGIKFVTVKARPFHTLSRQEARLKVR